MPKLNVSLLPASNVAGRAVEFSRAIHQRHPGQAYFLLEQNRIYPHVTLYATEFPQGAVGQVMTALTQIIKKYLPVRLAFKRVEAHQGYIGIEFERSGYVAQLHRDTLEALHTLRISQPDVSGYDMAYTIEQNENLQQYGYADALHLYVPHLTVARLRDEATAEQEAESLKVSFSDSVFETVGLFEMGDHGTCTKLIQQYKLSPGV